MYKTLVFTICFTILATILAVKFFLIRPSLQPTTTVALGRLLSDNTKLGENVPQVRSMLMALDSDKKTFGKTQAAVTTLAQVIEDVKFRNPPTTGDEVQRAINVVLIEAAREESELVKLSAEQHELEQSSLLLILAFTAVGGGVALYFLERRVARTLHTAVMASQQAFDRKAKITRAGYFEREVEFLLSEFKKTINKLGELKDKQVEQSREILRLRRALAPAGGGPGPGLPPREKTREEPAPVPAYSTPTLVQFPAPGEKFIFNPETDGRKRMMQTTGKITLPKLNEPAKLRLASKGPLCTIRLADLSAIHFKYKDNADSVIHSIVEHLVDELLSTGVKPEELAVEQDTVFWDLVETGDHDVLRQHILVCHTGTEIWCGLETLDPEAREHELEIVFAPAPLKIAAG